jgi:predicted HTH domain antitoxin
MRIDLPDVPSTETLTPEDMRLELACALYARGRIGKVSGAKLAGVDFFSFQQALHERGIPLYTEEMLANDIQTVKKLYPK